jgi:hypothetical protein
MIFSKDITPVCAYCEHGRQIMSTDDVICEKKGIVKASYGCRKFRYTPLKRIPPKKVAVHSAFTKEDFEF